MTQKQKIYRYNLLKKIHTNDAYKLIKANNAWEMWLEARFGESSCANLSIKELLNVLLMLNSDKFEKYEPDIKGRLALKSGRITKRQFIYIKSLCKALNYDENKLCEFAIKQTKIVLSSEKMIELISKKEATKIINGLQKIVEFKVKKQ